MKTAATFKHAVVTLMRRPALPMVIVGMLAVGIATVTVMFTLFDAVLLRGLPYQEPQRLVHVWGRPADPALGGSPESRWWTSYPDLEDLRREQTHFEELAGYIDHNIVVRTTEMPPRRLKAGRVSAEFFPLLGASAEQGRLFTAAEDEPGAEPVVVLDAGFARQLGIGRADLGRAVIHLNEVSHRVIGTVPESFNLPRGANFWMPLGQNMGQDNRGQHTMKVLGRLKPGSTIAGAQSELAAITARLAAEYPEANTNRSAWVEPLEESLVGGYRGTLSLLLGACALLMLVVAVNVAGLLVVRALRRRREVAIRRSLGATRGRLASQLLAESLLLGLGGALAGLLLAWLALGIAPAWLPADLPFAERAGMRPAVLAFALAVAVISAVGFGLLPAVRGARSASVADLKGGAEVRGRGGAHLGVGGSLLVTQIALAFALVAGSAMLAATAHGLLTQPLGFEPQQRLAFRIFLPAENYHPINEPRRANAYYRQLLEGVNGLPGVRSASVASAHPLEPHWTSSYWIEGREPPAGGVLPEASFRPVGPGYFETLGIPLLSGRGIAASDDFEAAGVVVINQAFARQHFPGTDPVGQYLTKNTWWEERRAAGDASQRWRIVGVAGDVLFGGPGTAAAPALYFSQAQWPLEDRFLLVHAQGDPASLVRPIQEVIWSIDDSVPADAITFFGQARGELLRDRMLATSLMAGFALMVVALSVSGLYALLSFAVGLEQRHIGIRLAVGASPRVILRRYLKRGLLLVLAGLAAGTLIFLAARTLLAALTAVLGPVAPAVLAGTAALFMLAAMLGAVVPARRAAALSPMEVLRNE